MKLKEQYNLDNSLQRKHQLRMLDILQEVDRLCNKYDITYWISDGTLLGAVRHKGFIPWDDDLDIQMPYKDFKRFLKIASVELPQDLIVQNHKTDNAYVAPYAKIRDLKSSIVENNNIDKNYKYRGIYIDIFPMSNCNSFLNKISAYLHYYLLYIPSHYKRNLFWAFWLNAMYVVLSFVYAIFRLIDYLLGIEDLNYIYGSNFNVTFPKKIIYPVDTIIFEGITFKAPHDSHGYLTQLYGDYMKLPPVNERITHTEQVNFD